MRSRSAAGSAVSAMCVVALAFGGCGGGASKSGGSSATTSPSSFGSAPVSSTSPRREVALSAAEAKSGLFTIPVPAGLKLAPSTKDSRAFELPSGTSEATVRSWYDKHLPTGRALGSLPPCLRLETGGLIRQWQPRDASFYVNVSVNVYSEPPTLNLLRADGGDAC